VRISSRKKIGLIITIIILMVAGIADLAVGKYGYGTGMIAGAAGVALLSWRNIKNLERMEQQGINPYDERVMQVAGLAAQGALKLVTLGLALFVGAGAVIGPVRLVNPYNFAGYLLASILLLYIGLFAYHNQRS